MQIVEMKLYKINLTEEERQSLTEITKTGRHAAHKILHAKILLKADEGLKDETISEHLNVHISTIERTRKRCAFEGVEATLNPRPQPKREPKIDGEVEARLIQLACSQPPEGRQRWTLRLLSEKLVELEVIDSISYECVRQRLEKKRAKTLASQTVLHPTGKKRRVRSSDGGRSRSLSSCL
jgi:transposase